MRSVLLAAVLALGGTAPLAAQDEGNGSAPAPTAAPAPAQNAASEPIVLLSGPDALLANLGSEPLDPKLLLCLGPDELAVLASDRVIFQIAGDRVPSMEGKRCFSSKDQERKAFNMQRRRSQVVDVQSIQAMAEYDNAIASGKSLLIRQATERLVALGLSWVAIDDGGPEARGAMQLFKPPPPIPILFRVASASPAVLTRLPKGTVVHRSTVLCLDRGEQVTISGNIGQMVTYNGPGCLRRQTRPTLENIGAFTFG